MKDKPAPVVIRANAYDIDVYLSLCAAYNEMQRAHDNMERRIRAAPWGWVHLQSAIGHLKALVGDDNGLLATFPEEKRRSIRVMKRGSSYKIHHGPQAGQLDSGEQIVHEDDLNVLINLAHEQCKICLEGDKCRRCPLGKALDHVLAYDRDGGSWGLIDFETIRKREEEDKRK